MEKNNFYKNTGRIILAIGVIGTALLSSCLKDTSPGALDLSKSPALVGFQYYGFGATPLTTKVHGTATDNTEVKLTLSVASITLSSAVTVTIADDPADAQAYASANGGVLLPAADYTIAAQQVTIQPGQQYVTVKVNFKGNVIDYSSQNFMAIKITSANGALVASNLNVAILALTLQSPYEGDYSDNGYTLRINDPVLSGYHANIDQQCATISANSIGYTIVWSTGVPAGGVGGTFITVDPATNKVTMACSSNPTLANAVGYDNRYDPAKKTFYISMTWSTPGTRATTDTLVYKGPL